MESETSASPSLAPNVPGSEIPCLVRLLLRPIVKLNAADRMSGRYWSNERSLKSHFFEVTGLNDDGKLTHAKGSPSKSDMSDSMDGLLELAEKGFSASRERYDSTEAKVRLLLLVSALYTGSFVFIAKAISEHAGWSWYLLCSLMSIIVLMLGSVLYLSWIFLDVRTFSRPGLWDPEKCTDYKSQLIVDYLRSTAANEAEVDYKVDLFKGIRWYSMVLGVLTLVTLLLLVWSTLPGTIRP